MRTKGGLIDHLQKALGNTAEAKILAYVDDMQRFRNAKALAAVVCVYPKIKGPASSVYESNVIVRSCRAPCTARACDDVPETQPIDECHRKAPRGRRADTKVGVVCLHAQVRPPSLRAAQVANCN